MANHARCTRTHFAVILTALTPMVAVGQTPTGAPPRFVYVDLTVPRLNMYTNIAHAINDAGVATGVGIFSNNAPPADFPPLDTHAFTEAPHQAMVDISAQPSVGYNYSQGWDINNLGVVVGEAVFSNLGTTQDTHFPPVMWVDGRVIPLGHPNGAVPAPGYSTAYAINDRNQIVGITSPPSGEPGPRSFLWENGQMRYLNELGPLHSTAWDINNLGHIVGELYNPSFTPYLVHNGNATLFDFNGKAFALNDLDQVVGWPGFIWEKGKTVTLPFPPHEDCLWPRDINDFGDIVGDCTSLSTVLWREGKVYVLDDLIQPKPKGQYLWKPFGINNRGQIVGTTVFMNGSSNQGAFRLDPVTPDFDSDGVVTIQDLQQLLIVWGSATDPYMDLTGDGVVNSADLANLLVNWGNVPVRQPYSWTKNAP